MNIFAVDNPRIFKVIRETFNNIENEGRGDLLSKEGLRVPTLVFARIVGFEMNKRSYEI